MTAPVFDVESLARKTSASPALQGGVLWTPTTALTHPSWALITPGNTCSMAVAIAEQLTTSKTTRPCARTFGLPILFLQGRDPYHPDVDLLQAPRFYAVTWCGHCRKFHDVLRSISMVCWLWLC